MCKEELMRERERERGGESTTSVILRCYYIAAGSYILKFNEALLEVADIKRRDEFIHNSRVEIHRFVLCCANIQETKALYY